MWLGSADCTGTNRFECVGGLIAAMGVASNLADWNARLEAHFRALAEMRRAGGLPVFALEHGLDAGERRGLAEQLNASLARGERTSKYWLLWVVYSAEQGYDYDGEEFWETFDRRTPRWTQHFYRRSLRSWFGKFHDLFEGFNPTGPWASWFSIIACPITHAVLPRDLQLQLARALYTWRHALAKRIDSPPAELGHFLATASDHASSRFRNFLQQEEIVGRIVIALLGGRTEDVERFIHPDTLERIVTDLQKAGSGRAWLQDARKVVERARLHGTSSAHRATNLAGTDRREPEPQERKPEIMPALTLRRVSTDEWTPVVELPSLRTLAEISSEVSKFLRQTRCRVAGSPGALPAGWLLQSDQRRVLSSWPPSNEPVVKFDKEQPVLEHLLRVDGCITPGPAWLFRVGSDGLAREIIGRLVRPGSRYIYVSSDPIAATPLGEAVHINATGVSALALDIPVVLAPAQVDALRALRLGVAKNVRLAPVGLDARRWDGEGFAEWMDGETPCVSLLADFAVESYCVRLAAEFVHVDVSGRSDPILLRFPHLPVGLHALTVDVRPVEKTAPLISGLLQISVRHARPWIAGTAAHSGLVTSIEPEEPSLDRFWEGDVKLQVFGPADHHVRMSVDLLDAAGAKLGSEPIADLPLPVTVERWERALSTFLSKEQDPWAFLRAASGRLVVEGDQLGAREIALQRDVAPVRWVWHKSVHGTTLRLVDDHEGDDPPALTFYPFSHPAQPEPISLECAVKGFLPENEGGLCVVSYGEIEQALIVSMPAVVGGLQGLLVQPSLANLPYSASTMPQIADLVSLWSTAKLVGPLAGNRRDRVATALRHALRELVCGAEWIDIEDEYTNSPRGIADLRRFARATGAPSAFNFVLARDVARFQTMPPTQRTKDLIGLAQRYKIASREACSYALQVASWLERGGRWSEVIAERITSSKDAVSLTRAARFLTLATPVPFEAQPTVPRMARR